MTTRKQRFYGVIMETKKIFFAAILFLIFLHPYNALAKHSIGARILVESDLSSTSPNKPVRVDWYILVKNQLLALDVVTFPKIKGGESVPSKPVEKLEFKTITEDGASYQKALFFTQTVKSSSPGTIELSPLVLKITEGHPKTKENPFPFKKSKPEEISSAPLVITVPQ